MDLIIQRGSVDVPDKWRIGVARPWTSLNAKGATKAEVVANFLAEIEAAIEELKATAQAVKDL